MPKAKITNKGLIQEPGDGFEIEQPASFTGASTFSGSVVIVNSVTASHGMVISTPTSGTGPHLALTITASEGSSATANGIHLWGTGSSVGTNVGVNSTPPAGSCYLFFDSEFRPVGAGADRPSLKLKYGSTIYVISASTS